MASFLHLSNKLMNWTLHYRFWVPLGWNTDSLVHLNSSTTAELGFDSDYLKYNCPWHPYDNQVEVLNGGGFCRRPITEFAFVGNERSFHPCNNLAALCYLSKRHLHPITHFLPISLTHTYISHFTLITTVIWWKENPSSLSLLPQTCSFFRFDFIYKHVLFVFKRLQQQQRGGKRDGNTFLCNVALEFQHDDVQKGEELIKDQIQ